MYYFITNIHGASGKALLIWKKIKKYLVETGVQYKQLLSQGVGNAGELAKSVLENDDEDKKIVVVGGDGTINEVLNGIASSSYGEEAFSKVQFGVIPTGSGNDYCRGVGIMRGSKNTIRVLKTILSSSGEAKIDLGKVTADGNVHYFGISSGIGLDAIVTKTVNESRLKVFLNKIKMGGSAYSLVTLHTLATMKFHKVKAVYDGNEEIFYNKLIFLAGMNLYAEGGGVKMAPKAKRDDGKLTACVANGILRFFAYCVFPFLIFGAHSKIKGFTVKPFSTLQLESDEPLILHTDGEFAGEVKNVKWESMPSVMRILN